MDAVERVGDGCIRPIQMQVAGLRPPLARDLVTFRPHRRGVILKRDAYLLKRRQTVILRPLQSVDDARRGGGRMIKLWTLGALDLRGDDGRELGSILAQPKRLALLSYLAVSGTRGFQTREQVLALFWPELDAERARGALNRAIYYLRRSLGDGVLLSRGDDSIGICPEALWCDAAALEGFASSAQHREAVELYRGDLMEGFYGADAAFERWLDAERDRLRGIAHRSAWALAEAELEAGHHAQAAHWGRWAVERSPYDEAAVQRLLCVLDRIGDRAGAVHAYELFATRLAGDLELDPSPETRALVEAIRSRDLEVAGLVPAARRATIAAHQQLPPMRRPRFWRRPAVAVAGLATLFGLAAAGLAFTAIRRSAPDPRLVAIMPIENRTDIASLDPVARYATDWIERSVADVVESTGQPTPPSQGRVIRADGHGRGIGRAEGPLRPGIVVRGEFYPDRGRVRFHLRVVDAVHGGTAWTIPALSAWPDSTEGALRELAQRATGAVAAMLDPGLVSWFPVATAPPTYDALVEYLRGASATPFWEAAPHFERAVALDSTFTWALLSAARARMPTDPVESRAILDALDRKRDRLPPLQIQMLESLLAEMAGDRPAVYRATARAASLAPTDGFLLAHASSAYALYRPREALRVLDRIVSGNGHGRGLLYWQFRTMAYHDVGEHRTELALSHRARREFTHSLGGLYGEVRALAALGRASSVSALVDSALSAPLDRSYTPGAIMMTAAEEFRAHGHPEASEAALRRAIQWYRSIPAAQIDTFRHDYSLAGALYRAGEWNEAETLLRRLLDAHPTWRAETYGRLGAIAARRGDRAAAASYLAILDSLQVPANGPAYEAGLSRARITALLGDADAAVRILRQAVGGQGMDLHADVDFESLANVPAFREFTRPKG
jgi:DNA-binding SARP family transcriptional activator/tetratricopeptide (TPR) repeat protein